MAVSAAAHRSGFASMKGRKYSGVPFSLSPFSRRQKAMSSTSSIGTRRIVIPTGRASCPTGASKEAEPPARVALEPELGSTSSSLRRSMTVRIPALKAARQPSGVTKRKSPERISAPRRVKRPSAVRSPPRSRALWNPSQQTVLVSATQSVLHYHGRPMTCERAGHRQAADDLPSSKSAAEGRPLRFVGMGPSVALSAISVLAAVMMLGGLHGSLDHYGAATSGTGPMPSR